MDEQAVLCGDRNFAWRRGQVAYGSGPVVPDPQSGKYRHTRVFVLALGYSRKSVGC
jgi:hypothetical protein